MMIVLAIIAMLVVGASPTVVQMMRDRRVSRAAGGLVDFMRIARTRAIGKGQPILVSWNGAGIQPFIHPGGTGYIEIDEPIVTKNNMANTCDMTQWRTAATQMVDNFDIQNGLYDYTAVTFYDEGGNNPMGADICFSPTGRMYIRTGSAGSVTGAFSVVTGVPSFAVFNTYTNAAKTLTPGGVGSLGARWVFVMPNGVARVQL
jgi:Tfp pilus assembly protein FimT